MCISVLQLLWSSFTTAIIPPGFFFPALFFIVVNVIVDVIVNVVIIIIVFDVVMFILFGLCF